MKTGLGHFKCSKLLIANFQDEVLVTVKKHLDTSTFGSSMLCKIARIWHLQKKFFGLQLLQPVLHLSFRTFSVLDRTLIDGEKLADPPERRARYLSGSEKICRKQLTTCDPSLSSASSFPVKIIFGGIEGKVGEKMEAKVVNMNIGVTERKIEIDETTPQQKQKRFRRFFPQQCVHTMGLLR